MGLRRRERVVRREVDEVKKKLISLLCDEPFGAGFRELRSRMPHKGRYLRKALNELMDGEVIDKRKSQAHRMRGRIIRYFIDLSKVGKDGMPIYKMDKGEEKGAD